MMIHAQHAVAQGFRKLLFVTADTDVLVLCLFHCKHLMALGVCEIWMRTGVDDSTRNIPIHLLLETLGPQLCSVLPAVHAITGADYTSKFSNKKAGLNCNPIEYLTSFATSPDDCAMPNSMNKAEEYLVQLWKRGSSCKTMDHLRLWLYHHSKTGFALSELPPTSRCAKGHLLRAYYHTYMQIHCLDKSVPDLDKQLFGFEVVDNMLMLTKLIKQFPSNLIRECHCAKCARSSCTCRMAELECCIYCKCQSDIGCGRQCANPFGSSTTKSKF